MKTLRVIVSGGKDHYGAWIEDIEGIYGVGATLEEVERDIAKAIELYTEYNADAPAILKEQHKLVLAFETSGLIKYYSQFLSLPAMERITGINQKQLWHYANGYKVPRKDTARKIEIGLKKFAKRLEEETVIV
jgi:predicted RNase H-like HicB family nuclease